MQNVTGAQKLFRWRCCRDEEGKRHIAAAEGEKFTFASFIGIVI